MFDQRAKHQPSHATARQARIDADQVEPIDPNRPPHRWERLDRARHGESARLADEAATTPGRVPQTSVSSVLSAVNPLHSCLLVFIRG
jgi:hypothetical protein